MPYYYQSNNSIYGLNFQMGGKKLKCFCGKVASLPLPQPLSSNAKRFAILVGSGALLYFLYKRYDVPSRSTDVMESENLKNSAVTANDVQRQNDTESEEAKKLTSMVPTATPTMEPEVNAKCEKASQENMPQAKDVAIEDDTKDDLEDADSYKFDYKPPTFKAGDEIFLVRLYADQNLNGQNGVILEELEDGTFFIELHKTKEQLKVRSQNLAHVENKDEESRENFRASVLLGGIGTAEEQEELRKAGLLSEDDFMGLLQEPKLKRISSVKVDATWKRCRGKDAAGPKQKNIDYAIKKSDANNDGKLTVDEFKRLTGAFVQHSGDSEMSSEKLFEILDENADGELTFDEVLTTFKAMYLLKSDGVKLDELLH